MSGTDPLDSFRELLTEEPPVKDDASDYYPGSKKKRRAVTGETPTDPFSDQPHFDLEVFDGTIVRFYPVGVLAEMLERKPPAIRKWERLGYLPEADYHTPGRNKHGQKRLYTREQIEGLVVLAREEGVLGDSNRNVSATRFPQRAAQLFKELAR